MTRSIRLALATFVVGFLSEAAAELYQLFSYGIDRPGWIGFYYIGLGTTGLGFYFMYRGRYEWTELHRRNVHRGHRLLRSSVAIFGGAVVAIAILGSVKGMPGGAAPAPVFAWLVGGLVALAFGNFFLGLATLVDGIAGTLGRLLAWTAFAWSLGVAVLTGLLVGEEFPTLLHEFVTNPLGLIVSFAPLAFVIAPLFVSYLCFAAAYSQAYLRLRDAATHPPPKDPGGVWRPRGEADPAAQHRGHDGWGQTLSGRRHGPYRQLEELPSGAHQGTRTARARNSFSGSSSRQRARKVRANLGPKTTESGRGRWA